jgi:hypothetical protein
MIEGSPPPVSAPGPPLPLSQLVQHGTQRAMAAIIDAAAKNLFDTWMCITILLGDARPVLEKTFMLTCGESAF